MIALGRVADARQGLAMVLKQCVGPEHDPLRQRAEALLALIAAQKPETTQENGND